MNTKTIAFQILLTTGLLSVAVANGGNSTCATPCGTKCCLETEQCSNDMYQPRCQQKGKKIDCSDGLSYCIEPSTCCGLMSCCPSDTVCCGINSCCAKGAVCCGMSTCCPEGSACCGFSMCCSRGSQCVNGLCRVPWSSSMRWYYLVAALVPFLFVMLYLAKRRQLRLAQQRGQALRSGSTGRRNTDAQEAPLAPLPLAMTLPQRLLNLLRIPKWPSYRMSLRQIRRKSLQRTTKSLMMSPLQAQMENMWRMLQGTSLKLLLETKLFP